MRNFKYKRNSRENEAHILVENHVSSGRRQLDAELQYEDTEIVQNMSCEEA